MCTVTSSVSDSAVAVPLVRCLDDIEHQVAVFSSTLPLLVTNVSLIAVKRYSIARQSGIGSRGKLVVSRECPNTGDALRTASSMNCLRRCLRYCWWDHERPGRRRLRLGTPLQLSASTALAKPWRFRPTRIHTGPRTYKIAERIVAAPIAALWSG